MQRVYIDSLQSAYQDLAPDVYSVKLAYSDKVHFSQNKLLVNSGDIFIAEKDMGVLGFCIVDIC
jgi:hypothetical protein